MKHLTQMTFAVMGKGWKMSRYIKVDAIVDKVCEGISCNECSFGTNEDGMSECVLQKRIDGLPTADAIPIEWIKEQKDKCFPYSITERELNDLLMKWERREDDTQD